MSDECNYYTVNKKNSFNKVEYNNPIFCDWKSWYAWFPVKVIEWNCDKDLVDYKTSKWTWLNTVMYRVVIDCTSTGLHKYHEYTTVEGLLRNG